MNYSDFEVTGLPIRSCYYLPNFVSSSEAEYLLSSINNQPKTRWVNLSNRRLQNWGVKPLASNNASLTPGIPEPLPPFLNTMVDRMVHCCVFKQESPPNHCLVNEYLPNQGIMPHEDGPNYDSTVATVSLGEHCLLDLYSKEGKKLFSLHLEPNSLFVMQKDAYESHLHGISESNDLIIDKCVLNAMSHGTITRIAPRVSLTFRRWRKIVSTKALKFMTRLK